MKDHELDQINAERRRRGLPRLSRVEAVRAVESRRADDGGFDMMHFLIGYGTGLPMPSGAGIMGAMLHQSSTPAYSATPSPEPSYSAPEPSPSPSYSSHDSGSSYDSSSSSSSSDSGSSGGGGSD
jgi:hypothetical protein